MWRVTAHTRWIITLVYCFARRGQEPPPSSTAFIRNTVIAPWLPSHPQMPTFSQRLFLNRVLLSPFGPPSFSLVKTGLHFAVEEKMCSIKLGQEDGYWYVFAGQPYCSWTAGTWSWETQIVYGTEQKANQIPDNLNIRNQAISPSFSRLRKGL